MKNLQIAPVIKHNKSTNGKRYVKFKLFYQPYLS